MLDWKMCSTRWLLPILMAALAALPLPAQAGGRRPFSVLGPEQGLPSGAVLCLTQDRDGFLWLGTENGLLRYEGGQCRHWSLEDGLPSAYVSHLLPDPDGGVWVATLRGLVRFRDGRFEPAVFGTEPVGTVPTFLAQDRKGRLWAATRHGRYVQEDGVRFKALPDRMQASPGSLSEGTHSGALYLAAPDGIQAFYPDGSTRRWGPAEGLPETGISLVAEDGEGRIWAGAGLRLFMLPPGGTRFQDESRRLKAALTTSGSPFLDRDGSLWLPTQDGALHLMGARSEYLDAAVGLPFRWVRTVFRDREGTLWVLGPALARLQGQGRVRNFTLSHGAFGEVVWYITHDQEGRLLVATDGGAARLGTAGLEIIPGTGGRRIKCLAQDRAGTLWMVTTVGPTLWLKPGQREAEIAPLGDLGREVNTVFQDRQGQVWLGSTRYGVLRWDPAARRLVQEAGPAVAGRTTLGAYQFSEDPQGRLWVGTTAGLLVGEPEGRWRFFTDHDGLQTYTVYGAAFLPDGSAWIHYQEPHGLTRVRLEGGRLQVLEQRTKGHGLRTNLIYAVQVDRLGRTWVSTDQGLDRLDPPVHVGRDEGMASEDCAILALLAEGGNVWVGTANGLVRYDAEDPQAPLAPPQARILQVVRGTRRFDAPFGTLGPVPSREATLEFHIAAPSFVNERALRFQVRLQGLEEEWHEAESRTVRYPALPGGHYRFEVRAANGDGPFGPAEGLDFTVRAPWWKRWWATTLAVLAALAAMYGVFRLRLAALARSKAELEDMVAQRTRELRLRNEELSEALGNVKQLSGLLPICAHCKKIRDDRGYWNQLEQYITERSEADFSHGICPDCAQEMFPEVALRRRGPKA
jgi:ligand-binding sensor domain-containing protein